MRFEETCCHRTSRKKISTDLDSMRYGDDDNNNNGSCYRNCGLNKRKRKNEKRNDTWENKIKRKTELLRSDISKIEQMCNNAKTPRIKRNNAEMKRKYKLYSDTKRRKPQRD